ncbi:MAG: DUF2189 domain-containing protein [Gammaproteobacteria bacterium]|nr:DUF2189 domain-containing protein [Gammaproteobacteria bacterium]
MNDMASAPLLSLLLGSVFTVLCVSAFGVVNSFPMFSVSMVALLLIVSPFLAAAAYSVARQREQKLTPSLRVCLKDIRSRALGIGMFSIVSALIVAAWVRLSGIAFALYYGTMGESTAYVARAWTSGSTTPSMMVFITAAGILLALTLFTIGAFALPMIADRNLNVINAAHSGIEMLKSNASTVLVWMLLLAVFITVALFSGLILMPVIFPLLAYATWHSYSELSTG